jgi:hypothetical protein
LRPFQKWLQTDFREERRWKTALAYEIAQWVMDWHAAEDKTELCVRVGKGRRKARADEMDVDGAMEGIEGAESGFGEGVSNEREEMDDGLESKLKDAKDHPKTLSPSSLLSRNDLSEPLLAISASTSANDTTIRPLAGSESITFEEKSAVEEALAMFDVQKTDEQREAEDDPLNLAASAVKDEKGGGGGEGGKMDVDTAIEEVEMVDVSRPPKTDSSGMPAVVETGMDLSRRFGEFPPPEMPAEDIKPALPIPFTTDFSNPTPSPAAPFGSTPLSSSSAPDVKAGLRAGAADPTLSSARLGRQTEVGYESKTVAARAALQESTAMTLTFPLNDILATLPPPFAASNAIDATPASTSSSLPSTSNSAQPQANPSINTSPFSPELSSLVLSDLFGDIALYTMPIPLSESQILSGRVDRRIDDATTSGGKLAHTSRLLDIRPVLVSTLQPSKRKRADDWEDLSDLWGVEETRDLMDLKTDPVPSGTGQFFFLASRL